MTKYSIKPILFLVLCAGCNPNRQKPHQTINEFEGVVTFKIRYENYKDSAKYGDTMRFFYSHGKQLDLYNSKLPDGMKKDLILMDENQAYTQLNNSDTLTRQSLAANSLIKLLSLTTADTSLKILGHPCKKISMVLQVGGKHTVNMYITHVYSPAILPFDADRFEGYQLMFINQLMRKAGAFYLYSETSMPTVGKMINEAVKIENKKLDPNIFEFDRTKVKSNE